MSVKPQPCAICPPPQDCVFPADLDLYGLQGPLGPWTWFDVGLQFGGGVYQVNPTTGLVKVPIVCPPCYNCPSNLGGGFEYFDPNAVFRTFSFSTSLNITNVRMQACLTDLVFPLNELKTGSITIYCNKQVVQKVVVPSSGDIETALKTVTNVLFTLAAQQQAICQRMAKITQQIQGPTRFVFNQAPNLRLSDLTNDSSCVGNGFSASVSAGGTFPPFTIEVLGGDLPDGLFAAESPNGTFLISGTPRKAGSFPFTLRVSDSQVVPNTFDKQYVITVSGILTDTLLPQASVCQAFSLQLAASVKNPPGIYTADNRIPLWLGLQGGGLLLGTPQCSDGSTGGQFGVTVTDQLGIQCSQGLTYKVGARPTLTILPPTLPSGVVGNAYSAILSCTGATLPELWTCNDPGDMPPGVFLLPQGVLGGTPTTQGSYTFILRCSDKCGCSVDKQFNVLIGTIGNTQASLCCFSGCGGVNPPNSGCNGSQGRFTVPANTYVNAGPYAGSSQADLNNLANLACMNGISSLCGSSCGICAPNLAGASGGVWVPNVRPQYITGYNGNCANVFWFSNYGGGQFGWPGPPQYNFPIDIEAWITTAETGSPGTIHGCIGLSFVQNGTPFITFCFP